MTNKRSEAEESELEAPGLGAIKSPIFPAGAEQPSTAGAGEPEMEIKNNNNNN